MRSFFLLYFQNIWRTCIIFNQPKSFGVGFLLGKPWLVRDISSLSFKLRPSQTWDHQKHPMVFRGSQVRKNTQLGGIFKPQPFSESRPVSGNFSKAMFDDPRAVQVHLSWQLEKKNIDLYKSWFLEFNRIFLGYNPFSDTPECSPWAEFAGFCFIPSYSGVTINISHFYRWLSPCNVHLNQRHCGQCMVTPPFQLAI